MKKNKTILISVLVLFSALLLSSCAGNSTLNNATSWPGITAEENTIYTAYNSFVSAVEDGQKKWSYPAEVDKTLLFYAAPVIDGDLLYTGTYHNQIHILNKNTGELVQKIELPSSKSKIIASPVINDGLMIIPSSDGAIAAYAVSDYSNPVWTTKLSSEVWTTPLVLDGKVYVSSLDKKLNMIDLKTGAMLESVETNGAIMDHLVYANGVIYFSTFGKEVHTYHPGNGMVETIVQTTGEIWAAPLVLEDRIITADMQGNVYCSDLKTEKSLWTLNNITGDGSPIIAAPVQLSNQNILIAAENGDLFIYDLDGKSVGTRSTKLKTMSSPVVYDDSFATAFIPGDSLLKSFSNDLKENWLYQGESNTAAKTPAK